MGNTQNRQSFLIAFLKVVAVLLAVATLGLLFWNPHYVFLTVLPGVVISFYLRRLKMHGSRPGISSKDLSGE